MIYSHILLLCAENIHLLWSYEKLWHQITGEKLHNFMSLHLCRSLPFEPLFIDHNLFHRKTCWPHDMWCYRCFYRKFMNFDCKIDDMIDFVRVVMWVKNRRIFSGKNIYLNGSLDHIGKNLRTLLNQVVRHLVYSKTSCFNCSIVVSKRRLGQRIRNHLFCRILNYIKLVVCMILLCQIYLASQMFDLFSLR